jgi:hypothetical protein
VSESTHHVAGGYVEKAYRVGSLSVNVLPGDREHLSIRRKLKEDLIQGYVFSRLIGGYG